MTGTRALHSMLTQEWRLAKVLPLPAMPSMRVALHLFVRADATDDDAADAADAANAANAADLSASCCAECGAIKGLRACPWTRTLVLCSERCWQASEAKHLAHLAFTFCGASCSARPKFESWEPLGWLESGEASEREWLALAQATPQPERLT